jgi:alpha-ribazole phosphatase
VNLILVRHAQPQVAPGVCYGALDVPADPLATQDAAQALAQSLPQHAQLWVSPLQRCELLAQKIKGLRPDLACKTDARLAEMNFGCYEGQRWADIPAAAYETWTTDFWLHRFGGVESLADVMARVADAWASAQACDQAPVWVTHAGVIRVASLLAQGVRRIDRAQDWPRVAPAFGQSLLLPLGKPSSLMPGA